MGDLRDLLGHTADLAADFYESLPDRPVYPHTTVDELRAAFVSALPAGPTDPARSWRSSPLPPTRVWSPSRAGGTSDS